jgi:hypothetical protein
MPAIYGAGAARSYEGSCIPMSESLGNFVCGNHRVRPGTEKYGHQCRSLQIAPELKEKSSTAEERSGLRY